MTTQILAIHRELAMLLVGLVSLNHFLHFEPRLDLLIGVVLSVFFCLPVDVLGALEVSCWVIVEFA